MKGIILAAGRGSRMKRLTDSQPKCLTQFHNKKLLEYQIEAFRSSGIENIAIVTGYLSGRINGYPLFKIHNNEWSATQMVYSLMCASHWLSGDDFIVSYSDIFYCPSALASLSESPYSLSVLYDPNWYDKWSKRFVNPLEDAESFVIRDDQAILNIGQKVSNVHHIMGQYMGLTRINKGSWERILKYYDSLHLTIQHKINFTELLSRLIIHNIDQPFGLPYVGGWGEIDSEKDLDAYKILYPRGIME